MKTEMIHPVECAAWDEFVRQHPLSSFYQQAAWADALQQTFPHTQPCYFVLKNQQGEIQAGLPLFLVKSRIMGNRLVSLPFTPNCDPLVETSDQWETLLRAALAYRKSTRADYLELRTFKCPDIVFNGLLTSNSDYATYELKLDQPPETLRKSFHKGCVQRSIKKAEKSGVQLRWGKNEADLRAFYDLLILTRRKHGFPPQPYGLYQNFWNHFFPKDQLELPLAIYDDRIIAGIMLFKYRDRVYYEFVASDINYLHVRPNHFLVWESIKAAHQQGFRIFDFGKTPLDNRGLVEFKERWGATARALTYRYFPEEKAQAASSHNGAFYRMVQRYFRSVPLPLAKMSGRMLYRHLG